MTATAETSITRPRRRAVAATAGLLYTASWIAGLSVAPAGTDVSSDGAAVVRTVAAHQTATAWQYVLTEIVPALALAVAVSAVAAHARRIVPASETRWAGLLRGSALTVAGLSLVQGVLGLWLTLHAVPAADAAAAGTLFAAINRGDGVKMLVIAGMAVAGLQLGRARTLPRALPRWLTPVAAALAVTVALSGVGYLLLVPALALAAYASLPLLLVWVTGASLAVARAS